MTALTEARAVSRAFLGRGQDRASADERENSRGDKSAAWLLVNAREGRLDDWLTGLSERLARVAPSTDRCHATTAWPNPFYGSI